MFRFLQPKISREELERREKGEKPSLLLEQELVQEESVKEIPKKKIRKK